jgi:hypothetical protein
VTGRPRAGVPAAIAGLLLLSVCRGAAAAAAPPAGGEALGVIWVLPFVGLLLPPFLVMTWLLF